jgi:hypothetical protein
MKVFVALLLVLRVTVHAAGFTKLNEQLAENRRSQKEFRESLEMREILLVEERAILARIQKLTQSADKTRGVSPICPVHKVKMEKARVGIRYGMLRWDPAAEVRPKLFPFARDFIPGGCVITDDSPGHGTAYRCKWCVEAEKRWHPPRLAR